MYAQKTRVQKTLSKTSHRRLKTGHRPAFVLRKAKIGARFFQQRRFKVEIGPAHTSHLAARVPLTAEVRPDEDGDAVDAAFVACLRTMDIDACMRDAVDEQSRYILQGKLQAAQRAAEREKRDQDVEAFIRAEKLRKRFHAEQEKLPKPTGRVPPVQTAKPAPIPKQAPRPAPSVSWGTFMARTKANLRKAAEFPLDAEYLAAKAHAAKVRLAAEALRERNRLAAEAERARWQARMRAKQKEILERYEREEREERERQAALHAQIEEEMRRAAEEQAGGNTLGAEQLRQAEDFKAQLIALSAHEQFNRYENIWASLPTWPTADIASVEIPWPVLGGVWSPEDVTFERVKEFVLHPIRVSAWPKSKKTLVQRELLKWHSDKFAPIVLGRIREAEREAAASAADAVAKALTKLLLEV